MKPGDVFQTLHNEYTILAIGVDEIIVLSPSGIISFNFADEIFAGF